MAAFADSMCGVFGIEGTRPKGLALRGIDHRPFLTLCGTRIASMNGRKRSSPRKAAGS